MVKSVLFYFITHFGAFVVGAGIFGMFGMFVGYELAQSGKPALLLRNSSDAEVTEVVVRPHDREARHLGHLSPRGFQLVPLSHRDESLRITATTAEGKMLESKYVYVTAGALVFGVICGDTIVPESTL